jgi:hypothetical protein
MAQAIHPGQDFFPGLSLERQARQSQQERAY